MECSVLFLQSALSSVCSGPEKCCRDKFGTWDLGKKHSLLVSDPSSSLKDSRIDTVLVTKLGAFLPNIVAFIERSF